MDDQNQNNQPLQNQQGDDPAAMPGSSAPTGVPPVPSSEPTGDQGGVNVGGVTPEPSAPESTPSDSGVPSVGSAPEPTPGAMPGSTPEPAAPEAPASSSEEGSQDGSASGPLGGSSL